MVEAHFVTTHGADASAIFHMSWRKFRILLDAAFSAGNSDDPVDINALFDRAQGKPPADTVQKMELSEFVEQM